MIPLFDLYSGRSVSRVLTALLLLCIAGCSAINVPAWLSRAATAVPVSQAAAQQTAAPAPTNTPAAAATLPGTQILTLWVPPQFDPQKPTPAGQLLAARLKEFGELHPGAQVDVRIKAANGTSGLLESLTVASAAAPLASPSLIALPRADLEAAVIKGLVFSFDGYSRAISEEDWYEYARQLSQVQGGTYGLPFAGDALLLLYRPPHLTTPTDWPSVLRSGQPVIFPAADPQALVSLALYRGAGGSVEDDQRRPALDPEKLTRVFKLYADGNLQGIFPGWVSQYETDGQAWQAYREQRAQAIITWTSRYLSELPADTGAALLPTLGAERRTLATGWVWALSDPQPERRALSVELAEFLCASEFLATWTSSAGYLPPRPTALDAWQSQSMKNLLKQIALSAEVTPTNDLVNTLGPVLNNAALQIIKRQTDPIQAAQAAAEQLNKP